MSEYNSVPIKKLEHQLNRMEDGLIVEQRELARLKEIEKNNPNEIMLKELKVTTDFFKIGEADESNEVHITKAIANKREDIQKLENTINDIKTILDSRKREELKW